MVHDLAPIYHNPEGQPILECAIEFPLSSPHSWNCQNSSRRRVSPRAQSFAGSHGLLALLLKVVDAAAAASGSAAAAAAAGAATPEAAEAAAVHAEAARSITALAAVTPVRLRHHLAPLMTSGVTKSGASSRTAQGIGDALVWNQCPRSEGSM